MEEVRNFGVVAGPQVNWDKTKVMKINTDNANGECGESTEQPITYLGIIYIGKNKRGNESLIWDGKVRKKNQKYIEILETDNINVLW